MTAVDGAAASITATASITAVCVVHEILPDPGQDPEFTAIDKRPRPGRLAVGDLGLVDDTQCDPVYHGGPDRALYAYAAEDAAWWGQQLGREVPAGLFGENLQTSGLDVTGAEIGEQWRIGTGPDAVLVEVRAPRTPCVTFGRRMGEPRWVKRFAQAGRPGAYLRVLTPGSVAAGDPVQLVRRPGHGVGVGDVFPHPRPDAMRTLLGAADAGVLDLAPDVRTMAEQAVAAGR